MVVKSNSVKDTGKFASNLAKKFLKKGGIIALIGELGAGKTTFAQYFAKGLRIKEKIISPTFILMRGHVIPWSKKEYVIASGKRGNPVKQDSTELVPLNDNISSNRILYHLDLYRLESKKDFEGLGLEEIFQNKKNIILIEWADKISEILPENAIKISFKRISEKEREITLWGGK